MSTLKARDVQKAIAQTPQSLVPICLGQSASNITDVLGINVLMTDKSIEETIESYNFNSPGRQPCVVITTQWLLLTCTI